MFHRVDRTDPSPLHDQVAAAVRRAIADGEAVPGERLPPAMDLAAVLQVNRNTVLRALRILREEGLVDFKRGRGVHVTGSSQRSAIVNRVAELLVFAQREGYRSEDVITLIRQIS